MRISIAPRSVVSRRTGVSLVTMVSARVVGIPSPCIASEARNSRTVERSTAEWIATLEALAVPCGPINTLADVFADPQVQARGLKVTMPHPVAGQVPLVASPMKLSATPVDYRLPPPMLGEHTDEILAATLGLDAAAIARLRADGVV